MKRPIVIFFMIALAISGCVRSDYTGQKFAATPLSQEVKFFKSRAEIPQDEYTIIGRFTITAPEKSDLYTFQKELTQKGRAYGGDAVCLVMEIISAPSVLAAKGTFKKPWTASV